jgi:uncharacterized small protein (DUF1192 family)
MDERIMKVLEAAGGRIADLELDVAAMDEVNNNLRAEIERLNAVVSDKDKSVMFWFNECEKLKAQVEALKVDRANVEAVE